MRKKIRNLSIIFLLEKGQERSIFVDYGRPPLSGRCTYWSTDMPSKQHATRTGHKSCRFIQRIKKEYYLNVVKKLYCPYTSSC